MFVFIYEFKAFHLKLISYKDYIIFKFKKKMSLEFIHIVKNQNSKNLHIF
jgi:hypothetical protein